MTPDPDATLREALIAAYHAMDAACQWASGETANLRTLEAADRHMAGYDALLYATVAAGKAAGLLYDIGDPAAPWNLAALATPEPADHD